MGSWNRRSFGKAVGLAAVPTLLAVPTLGVAGPAPRPDGSGTDLWPEARRALDFYRTHLPAHLKLAEPTGVAAADRLTRTVTVSVMDRSTPVGLIQLMAAFPTSQQASCSWQAMIVSGGWYGASIRNAFRVHAVA